MPPPELTCGNEKASTDNDERTIFKISKQESNYCGQRSKPTKEQTNNAATQWRGRVEENGKMHMPIQRVAYIAVVDLGLELNLRGLEGVVVREVNLQEKDTALIWAAGRTLRR